MRVCTLRHSSNQNAPFLALSFFILLFILILLLIYLFIFFKISRYTCLSRSIYFAGCSINRRISRFLEKYRDYDRQTAMLSSRIRGNARRSSRSVATPAVHALLPIGDWEAWKSEAHQLRESDFAPTRFFRAGVRVVHVCAWSRS